MTRLGRVAWAPVSADMAPPWRRIWWRLWWRGRIVPAVKAPPTPLHWAPGLGHYPLCGATIRERWTIIYDHATCPACVEQGLLITLQRGINLR